MTTSQEWAERLEGFVPRDKEVRPSKAQVRSVIEEVEELDLPDGAHWAMVHDRLGLEYGDVFEYIADDPEYFSATKL